MQILILIPKGPSYSVLVTRPLIPNSNNKQRLVVDLEARGHPLLGALGSTFFFKLLLLWY